jgi:hypothetical protein
MSVVTHLTSLVIDGPCQILVIENCVFSPRFHLKNMISEFIFEDYIIRMNDVLIKIKK